VKKLERFILREIISDGVAGTVYKAEEVLPGENRRVVALKVMPAIADGGGGDKLAQDRFFNEVKVLSQLTVQPHVVTIYAMGQTEGYPWLAMEYAETTAQTKITEEPAMPAEVLKLLEQIGQGLKAIHALDPPLIHQDIKPANILVDAGGNYKITDFSLATVVAANRTHGLATVRYAAPEMLSSEFGHVGPATDLYSLGHIAYELALGGRLHRAQFPAVFEGNSNREPPPNKWMMWHASGGTRATSIAEVRKDFPPEVSDVVAKLMAKSLSARYASASELLSDLTRLSSVRPQENVIPLAAVTPPSSPPLPLSPSTPLPMSIPTPQAPTAAHPAAAATPHTKYYVRLRGRTTGPFDLATLQRQVRQGQLSRLHQVSTDQATWRSAAEIEGLYGPTVV